MKQRNNKNGSKNDDWLTPPYLLEKIKSEFGDFFDPCPYKSDFDGLAIDWEKVNYINPPYSSPKKSLFIKKAIEEYQKDNTCILLIPANTETRDFKLLWNVAKEIRFLHKRIKFHGFNTKGEWVTNNSGQTGSMLVILKEHNQDYPDVSLIEHI